MIPVLDVMPPDPEGAEGRLAVIGDRLMWYSHGSWRTFFSQPGQVGTIICWAGRLGVGVLPDFIVCEGQPISRATYADLFAVIGTTYGAGDGSSTFNVPDLKWSFPVGLAVGYPPFEAMGNRGHLDPPAAPWHPDWVVMRFYIRAISNP
jgi:hypothetical protein